MLIIPISLFAALNERIAIRSGTNKNRINPRPEATSWIFEAIVTVIFDSFKLKKLVKIHEPTANIDTKKRSKFVKQCENLEKFICKTGSEIKKSKPSINIQRLNGSLTGLLGLPSILIDIFALL